MCFSIGVVLVVVPLVGCLVPCVVVCIVLVLVKCALCIMLEWCIVLELVLVLVLVVHCTLHTTNVLQCTLHTTSSHACVWTDTSVCEPMHLIHQCTKNTSQHYAGLCTCLSPTCLGVPSLLVPSMWGLWCLLGLPCGACGAST